MLSLRLKYWGAFQETPWENLCVSPPQLNEIFQGCNVSHGAG